MTEILQGIEDEYIYLSEEDDVLTVAEFAARTSAHENVLQSEPED